MNRVKHPSTPKTNHKQLFPSHCSLNMGTGQYTMHWPSSESSCSPVEHATSRIYHLVQNRPLFSLATYCGGWTICFLQTIYVEMARIDWHSSLRRALFTSDNMSISCCTCFRSQTILSGASWIRLPSSGDTIGIDGVCLHAYPDCSCWQREFRHAPDGYQL